MSNNILFVFEGEKTEDLIIKSLKNSYLSEKIIITSAYCNTIYQFYKLISGDEDLDTFNLLKEIEVNKATLQDFTRSDFAEIYMFFDYDGHDTSASDDNIINLLGFFNNETEKGKLYISYPMVEALRHISEPETNFKDLKVECKVNINYKKVVHDTCMKCYSQYKKYDEETWNSVICLHLMKMNYIVNGSYEYPNGNISQLDLFYSQQQKYINIDSTIGVLSSFPVFLFDYYGENLKAYHWFTSLSSTKLL
ncbi:hypothetical protein [Edaphocola aurantiacus]|uniref:hypothetical protein n=1 Tax=Edaphocola aurantiacus TaxID=2601682 RepID=UPI001C94CA03|nr:hypothetical protein [Edaphocola aurantiacus]